MGHNPDPAAETEQLRGLIRDAHAAVKDLRAAIREAQQLGGGLAAQFQERANDAVKDLANHLQRVSDAYAMELNAAVEAARNEIAQRLFDARIEYDQAADNFVVVFSGAKFAGDNPAPYPERMSPP